MNHSSNRKPCPKGIAPTRRSLSPPRQRLLELMQEVRFGRIKGLHVRQGEPVLNPGPEVLRDVVFGKDNRPGSGRRLGDFALKHQVVEMLDVFEREPALRVKELVVQDGLPVRMTVESEALAG